MTPNNHVAPNYKSRLFAFSFVYAIVNALAVFTGEAIAGTKTGFYILGSFGLVGVPFIIIFVCVWQAGARKQTFTWEEVTHFSIIMLLIGFADFHCMRNLLTVVGGR